MKIVRPCRNLEITTEAKDTKDVKFRATVIKGETAVAAHKNMAYDLKKKL
jgi:putative membrane protein